MAFETLRTTAHPAGRSAAHAAEIDAGLRKHMLGIYNYMTSGVLLTGNNVREPLEGGEKARSVGEGRITAAGEPATILANRTVREVYLGENFSI